MISTDFLIVGAGITGSAAAYFLSLEGKDVVVVDSRMNNTRASGSNAGTMVAVGSDENLVKFGREGIRLWKQISDSGVDVGFSLAGEVRPAFTAQEVENIRALVKKYEASGISMYEISGEEARVRYPYLAEDVLFAAYCPDAGYLNSCKASNNVLLDAVKRGTRFMPHQEVKTIERNVGGAGYIVKTQDTVYQARKVLLSGGIWTPILLKQLGYQQKLYYKVAMMSVTDKAPPFLTNTVTGPGYTLKQTEEGTILIGGGYQGYGDFSNDAYSLSIANLCANIRDSIRVVPNIANLNIVRHWCCSSGGPENGAPKTFEVPGYPGIFAGINPFNGMTHGPYVARLLADMMLNA